MDQLGKNFLRMILLLFFTDPLIHSKFFDQLGKKNLDQLVDQLGHVRGSAGGSVKNKTLSWCIELFLGPVYRGVSNFFGGEKQCTVR